MRRWIGGILLAAVAACLFGCGATGPRYSEMAQAMPSLPDDQGRIYFYRDSIMGAAVQPDVVLNGRVIGKSQPNSFFYVDRPAGTYHATAQTEAEGSIDITVRPKQSSYVLMRIGIGFLVGRPYFEPVPEAQARSAMTNLAYGGPMPAAGATATAAAPKAEGAPAPVPKPAPVAIVTPPAVAVAPAPPPPPPPPPAPVPTPPPALLAAPLPTPAAPIAKTTLDDLRLLLPSNR